MAHFFADLVREACRDTGAGALVLAGPLAGHRGFAGTVPAGATFHYAIAGVTRPEEWETGIGRIDAAGRIERLSVSASSSAGGAVAFSAGLKTVALTVGASWYAAADEPATIGTVSGLQAALDAKQPAGSYAAAAHGHGIGDVTGLQVALDGKQAAGSYAAAAHSHAISNVTGLQAALDGKQAAGSYAAAAHGHGIGDVSGLQAALDGKQASGSYAPAVHSHAISNVTGLQTAINGRQPISTSHLATTTVEPGDQITVRRGSDWLNAPGSALVRVNASGRVGIGTASPSQTLEVAGSAVRLTGAASPAYQLQFSGSPPRDGQLEIDSGGNLSLRNLTAGGLFFDSFNGNVTFRNWGGGATPMFSLSPAALTPGADNARTLGTASLRFSTLFAASGTISTSDRALKKHVGRVPDAWLDAWGEVGWRRYRFRKGRRWHVGLIAQEVAAAFAAHGEDAATIGLLCRDRLEDGSERWGLRYDECLAMEAAWVRRELARMRGTAAR